MAMLVCYLAFVPPDAAERVIGRTTARVHALRIAALAIAGRVRGASAA